MSRKTPPGRSPVHPNRTKTAVVVLCLLCLSLPACSTLKDQDGNTVMSASGFGRDSDYVESIEVEYDRAINVTGTLPGWVGKSGVPLVYVKSIKAHRSYGTKSNVGPTASGLAQAVTAVSAASPF
jgi:hypothetical protein